MSTLDAIEKEIYDFLSDCDPSGKNTERMKTYLKGMSEKERRKFLIKFLKDDDMNIPVAYEPFNNPVNIQFIEKLAKKHNIPLYEYIYKPYVTGDVQNPPRTVYPVLVVDLPIKRLKQTVLMKTHTSLSNSKRDATTGQVTGDDKTARVTDVEGYSLVVQEMYSTLTELYGPMADDTNAMYDMIRMIQQNGEFELADIHMDPVKRSTLNAINYFLLGSGISTNLIEESGYVLPITLRAAEDRSTTIERK